MEELKILYKELEERQKHLESRKKTKTTEGRIAENLLTMLRVQQLLIPLVVQANKEKSKPPPPPPSVRIIKEGEIPKNK